MMKAMSWIAPPPRQYSCVRLLLLIISLFLPVLAMAQVPADPSNLVANPYSPGRINVYWYDNSNNETSFVLERKRPSTDWAIVATLSTNTWQYIDNNVSPTNGYYYRVKAVNASGESAWSNTASAVTPAATTLTVPTSALAKCIAYSKNQLTWTDTNTSEDGYRIERKIDGGSWTFVANTLPNVITYKDESLTADTNYSYRVRAYNVYYTSTWTSDLDSPTWKPYLSALISPTDVVSSAGTIQMRVERTASSSSPLTVTLNTNVTGASVPSSVTIPGNARSVSFAFVLSSNPSASTLATVTAAAEGWNQKLDLHVRRSTDPLAPSELTVTPGSGANWLSWKNPDNAIGATYAGVRVSRRISGGGWGPITMPMTLTNSYVDIVPSINQFEYRVDLVDANGIIVASSGTSTGTPTTSAATLSLSGVPTIATAPFEVTVGGSVQNELGIYVDGKPFGITHARSSNGQAIAPTLAIDPSDLGVGQHTIDARSSTATNGAWSNSFTFTVIGTTTKAYSDGIVVPEADMYCKVKKTFSSNNLNWTATIRSHAGTIVRTWSGNGAVADLVWDGRDENGDAVAVDRYYMIIGGDNSEEGYCDIVRAAANPEFLSVIMLPKWSPLGYNVCAGLADRVVESLDNYYGTTLPASVLIYTENTRMSDLMFKYLAYAFKTARWVHLDGHGTPTIFEAGSGRTIESGTGTSSDTAIFIEESVIKRGFGLKWLWMDCCFSAGQGTYSPGLMTDSPDLSFLGSAQIDLGLYSGGFMAWNGYSLFNFSGLGLATVENVWGRWRRLFLVYFISGHMSMQEAIVNATLDCGVPETQYYPYSGITLSGEWIPKLENQGEVYMP